HGRNLRKCGDTTSLGMRLRSTSESCATVNNSESQQDAMIVNMVVDLSGSFSTENEAALLSAAGLSLEHRSGAAEPDIAWIRDVFGGDWHSESASGWNFFARKADG